MNKVHLRLQKKLQEKNISSLEYGNLRKGSIWGMVDDNTLKWCYEIDMLSAKPMVYVISYDLIEKKYSCFTRVSNLSKVSNVLAISTKKLIPLEERLRELIDHIPSLRERLLREYLFTRKEPGLRRKLLKIFKKSKNRSEYLNKVIDELFSQQKISEDEAQRGRIYAKALD